MRPTATDVGVARSVVCLCWAELFKTVKTQVSRFMMQTRVGPMNHAPILTPPRAGNRYRSNTERGTLRTVHCPLKSTVGLKVKDLGKRIRCAETEEPIEMRSGQELSRGPKDIGLGARAYQRHLANTIELSGACGGDADTLRRYCGHLTRLHTAARCRIPAA